MKKQKSHNILLYFVIILLIPLTAVLFNTTAKVLDIFVLHRTDYIFKNTPLIENVIQKYGDRATFRIIYSNQTIEGRDRGLFWAHPGDIVRIYFNKKDIYDNGIVLQLISLAVGQWMFFIAIVTYVIIKLATYLRIKKRNTSN